MDDLYRELIIDRYQNPRFRGALDPHTHSYEDDNPVCGDHIRVDLRVNDKDFNRSHVQRRRLFHFAGIG